MFKLLVILYVIKLYARHNIFKYISINNHYQQDSRVLHIFVPYKSFGQLLNISPKKKVYFNGFLLEIYLDQKFQWLQGGLNCEPIAYEVVT